MPTYPLETHPLEIERLRVQSAAMAPDTQVMLERIGVQPGWNCLDLGCGPTGIADLLSPMSSRVTGLDKNESFLEYARRRAPANVEYLPADAYRTEQPDGSIDLVHMRFLASTAGDPERLLSEAMRVTRAGGVVALQEPDGRSLNCYPAHPAWERLKAALLGAFSGAGADLTLAHRLYALAHDSGLEDVQYRTFVVAVRTQDPMVDYLPSTIESLRDTIFRLGLIAPGEFA